MIKFFLTIICFIIKIKADNQILITFSSTGNQFIYCDDLIKYFGTTYITIYRKLEDKKIKINSNSLIHNINNNDICRNKIYYYSETEYETILIEFKIFPTNLHGLFRQSDINSIEINLDNNNEELDFSNMFQDCEKLTSIDLSNFNFCNVEKFNKMFSGCTNLQHFSLPKELPSNCINFKNVDFSEMFFNCVSLTSIDLSYIAFDYVNNITNIFSNCFKIQSIKLKGNIYLGIPINNEEDNLPIDIIPAYNNLKELNLFDMNMKLTDINLNNLNSLEECLYFEYYKNIKKCSKYMGFHFCGDCINDNINNYCTKIIGGIRFNFYYLEHQLNISIESRECYWSNNFTNFLSYKFIYNKNLNQSYYTYIYYSCEKYSNGTYCIQCNNNNGFYKIENEVYRCSDKPPAKNYVLDIEAKEWRKCNKRCKKCYMQSKSEIHHQCISCNNYYYPFKIDYDNYINNKITGFNCFTFAEVYSKYLNYFLNINDQFEKCDISCEKCETKNKCLNCSQNYYYIYGNENNTCFHEPLARYGLTKIDDNLYFIPCFKLCKYCNKISQSFLNQQCTECDEIDYTLDIYSYNKFICMPKDKSNLPSIKEKTKWYIDGNFNELNMANKGLTIDYEILLNNEKYYNLSYKIVEECPENKPYIIYSIRQCVSSCKSPNLIENGIFMTEKLYLYNNICYHKCPKGSIEDDINDICIETNNNTSINKSLTSNEFKEYNELYILKYLTESANNTVEILRAYDFSNYFYNQNENYSHQLQLQMPIFNFTQCIEKLMTEYNLFNNNFFYGIIEYNDQINKNEKYIDNLNLINSTSYQFFLENGTILNYEICEGLNITTEKKIEINKINIDILNKVEDIYNISLFDNNNEKYNDYCIPFSIDSKDLTLYERKLLINQYYRPCDDDCIFQLFNFTTYYSKCVCPIKVNNEKINIKDKILEEINNNEYINLLLHNSNYKYFKCYKSFLFLFKKQKGLIINFFFFISLFFILLQSTLFFLLYEKFYLYITKKIKNKNKNIENKKNIFQHNDVTRFYLKKKNIKSVKPKIKKNYDNKLYLSSRRPNKDMDQNDNNDKNDNNIEVIQENNNNVYNIEVLQENNNNVYKINSNDKYTEMDFKEAEKKDKRGIFRILCDNLMENACIILQINNDDDIVYIVMKTIISLHTFFFINTMLFTDKYIKDRNTYNNKIEIEFLITKEFDRYIYTFIICLFIIKFINRLYKNIFYIVIILLHLSYGYFITIFGIINSHIQIRLIRLMLIYLGSYFFIYLVICAFISLTRFCSLKKKYKALFELSNFIKNNLFNKNYIVN